MKKLIGRGRKGNESGQSLVELSLGLTFLLIVVAGMLDIGRLFYTNIALYNAAEEGTLYVCSRPTCTNSSLCADPDNMEYRIRHESEGGLADMSGVQITLSPTNPLPGDVVNLSVSSKFFMIAPFVSALAPDGLTLTGTATCRVFGES